MFASKYSLSLFAIGATTGLVAAQNLGNLGLSQSCQTALENAIDTPAFSTCMNILGALPVVTSTTNDSLVSPVASWLNGLCAASPCDNATLTAAATNISSGCQSDLSSHETGVSAATILNTAIQFYPTVRQVVCLKDTGSTGSGELCITELLTDVQTAVGQPLSINTLSQIPAIISSGNFGGISIPKNITCSNCTQAAWSIVDQQIPQAANVSVITSTLNSQCGASFVSSASSLPANIVEGTGTAAPSASSTGSKSGAVVPRISMQGLVGALVASTAAILAGSAIIV